MNFLDMMMQEASRAIGRAFDIMVIDSYPILDTGKLDMVAGDPVLWRSLLGRWAARESRARGTVGHRRAR